VTLHDFGDEVRGVLATKRIAEGEVIIEVPEPMLMTMNKVKNSDIGPLLAEHQAVMKSLRMGENAATITLYLMHERGKPDSFWRTYIDMLPKNFTSPMFWEDDVLEELQSQEFLRHVQANRAMQSIDFKAITPMLQARPDLFPEASSGMEDFRWCSTIVITRYCELDIGGRTVALAPMYDLSNHDPHTKTSFGWNSRARSLTVSAGKHYIPGEQIYMSYGSKANFDLLYVYGIAFVHNPYGSVRVGVPQLPADHREVIEAIAKHNKVDLLMSKLVRYDDIYKVPDNMLQTMRISLLRRYDLERLGISNWNASANLERGQHVVHAQVNPASSPQYYVHALEPISLYNELCVFMFLLRSLIKRYAKYSTSLATDWSLHSNTEFWQSIERKQRLAIIFRIDEKQNVLHMYKTIQSRRAKYLHDQLGGWEPPAALKHGTVGKHEPRHPSFVFHQRWQG